MNQFGYKPSYKRNLPHIQPPEATLFVTFRLDGSIPEPVLEQWRIEKKRLEMTIRRGQFWQHESFDHVIRNQAEWERVVNYVVSNPVKAGLVKDWESWKWSYRRRPPLENNPNERQP